MINYNAGISQVITHFIKACQGVKTAYKFLPDKIKECENKTIDFHHDIELNDLSYHEMARMTKKEKENLATRRQLKNEFQLIEPLAQFLDTKDGENFLKRLETVLGETRKVENYHRTRIYKRRSKEKQEVSTNGG